MGRLCDDSIIGELTAWRSGQSTGVFPYSLRLADQGDRHVVVKIKPRDRDAIAVGQALADVCDERIGLAYARWSDRLGLTGADRREAAIYAQRDGRFVTHAPAVLGIGSDETSGQTTIVLERLTGAALAGSVERPELWNPAAIDTAIRGLAALQSIWLDRTSTLAAQPWIGHIPSAASMSDMLDFWTASASHARSRFATWAGDSMAPIQDRLIESVGDWWTAIDEGPRTLIHNDFNPRNICLRREPDGLRLVAYDWELATIGAPQHDLAELLCFVVTERTNRQDVHAWIERHRVLLEAETGAAIDRREWINGFRASLYDLLLNRLPMYCLIDRVRRQRFLPRVVRTWRRLYQWFPLGD
jgi:aminoglycoside phosphotransferase (APT) family kinase protein